MTNDEARAIFDQIIARTYDPERIAKLELCREFFCSPGMRNTITEFVWNRLQNMQRETANA